MRLLDGAIRTSLVSLSCISSKALGTIKKDYIHRYVLPTVHSRNCLVGTSDNSTKASSLTSHSRTYILSMDVY